MVTVQKTGEDSYFVSPGINTDELIHHDCNILRRELVKIAKPHREIAVDFKGIKKVENESYKILLEIKETLHHKNCSLKLLNANPFILKKLSVLSKQRQKHESELA
jgi:hypothetical protein